MPPEKEQAISHAKEESEKERTRKLSIKEAAVASVMTGAGTSYISPYALALNANNAQIGFLSSFASLLSPISQIYGSKLMERVSRKRMIVISVFMHAFMWLPIIFLSLFFWKNMFTANLPVILIIFYSLFAIFGSVAGPAWFSLMGDLVPEKIRGKYFSKRNKIAEAIALLSMLVASFALDYFKTKGIVLMGFSIIFLAACIARLISALLLRKHYYPRLKLEKGYYFSIFQFLKKAPSNNYGRFVIFVALMHFTVNISGPFFSVYMLKDLGFSYTEFMLTSVVTSIVVMLFLPLVGKFSDKFGNRELLRFGSAILPVIPILWMLSPSHLYIILVPQIISGIGWAAFNFAVSNFVYDSVTPQRRAICVAYLNVVAGIGVFFGATIGGLLAQYLNISFMNILLFLFLISAISRFIVSLLIPMIKEVRKVHKPREYVLSYFRELNPAVAVTELSKDMIKIRTEFTGRKKS
jgi:MFS family permease